MVQPPPALAMAPMGQRPFPDISHFGAFLVLRSQFAMTGIGIRMPLGTGLHCFDMTPDRSDPFEGPVSRHKIGRPPTDHLALF